MMYKVIERKDPRNPEGQGKYYGLIVNMSNIGIDELATRISATCTVTRHDCLAVLSALQEQIIYALKEGRRVHLGRHRQLPRRGQRNGQRHPGDLRHVVHAEAPRPLHAQHQAQERNVLDKEGLHLGAGGLRGGRGGHGGL